MANKLQSQKYRACIDACNECLEACELCAVKCLYDENVKSLAKCVEICLEKCITCCYHACAAALLIMSAETEYTKSLQKLIGN